MNEYKEKINKENEGFENGVNMEEDEAEKIVYVFRNEVLIPKFKAVNKVLMSNLQSFSTNIASAIMCFADYLEKEVILFITL